MGNLVFPGVVAACLGVALVSPAEAASREQASADYAVDAITVATPGREAAPPTANCIVWANAEGLGVGPTMLDGLHGVAMNINPHPLPNEAAGAATSFENGLAELQSLYPKAPPWLLATIRKQRAAIEAACSKNQATPFKVYSIGAKDHPP